ncbi:hypothetical protein DRO38_06320 [Candidatus Bathyarchaeota archaeon]|nr:MAG: hypothetical protein DRO38_06320 [Candidatus Bathyarchaeota archaeon]
MNIFFTLSFLAFMVIMGIHRIWETFLRKGKVKGNIVKGWTLPALTIAYIMVCVGAVVEYFVIKRPINFIITFLGFSMYLIGLVGRSWAIKTLGRYHSVQIEIRNRHPLIREGPYKYLRHPIYFSIIFEILGIPLVPNSYYACLIALFIYIPLLFIRLRQEEKVMIEKFGDVYLQYKREVDGLLPFKLLKK